tara:strand:- start:299 stop:766 length:468 start_codon:yes stop_codon:yes gene_type:complete
MSELRTNRIVPRDGLPSGSAGGIIQIKQSLYNTYSSSNSNTSMAAISGWTVVITPTRSDSKMLVTVNISVECRSSNIIGVELTRNGTAMFNNKGGFRGDNSNGGYITFSYLDSPATTSAVTYGVQTAANTGTYAINNYFGGGPCTSFLTVMEVSG